MFLKSLKIEISFFDYKPLSFTIFYILSVSEFASLYSSLCILFVHD